MESASSETSSGPYNESVYGDKTPFRRASRGPRNQQHPTPIPAVSAAAAAASASASYSQQNQYNPMAAVASNQMQYPHDRSASFPNPNQYTANSSNTGYQQQYQPPAVNNQPAHGSNSFPAPNPFINNYGAYQQPQSLFPQPNQPYTQSYPQPYPQLNQPYALSSLMNAPAGSMFPPVSSAAPTLPSPSVSNPFISQLQSLASQLERENETILQSKPFASVSAKSNGAIDDMNTNNYSQPQQQQQSLDSDAFVRSRPRDSGAAAGGNGSSFIPTVKLSKVDLKHQEDIKLMKYEMERLLQLEQLDDLKDELERKKQSKRSEMAHNEWLEEQKRLIQVCNKDVCTCFYSFSMCVIQYLFMCDIFNCVCSFRR